MCASLKHLALGITNSVFVNLLLASIAVSQTETEKDATVTHGAIRFTPPNGWKATKRNDNFYTLLANGR